MDPRLPLPNCLRCPALALFRKYNYPDSKLIEAVQDPAMKEHLKLISDATVEIKEDGIIQEFGRRIEPEHITRRTRSAHDSSGGSATDSKKDDPIGGGLPGSTEAETKRPIGSVSDVDGKPVHDS